MLRERPSFSDLKSNAYASLKPNWGNAIIVCIITSMISGGGSGGGGGSSSSISGSSSESLSENTKFSDFVDSVQEDGLFNALKDVLPNKIADNLESIIFTIIGFIVVSIILSILINTFIGNPTKFGKSRFFMLQSEGLPRIRETFAYFFNGNYLKTVKTGFIKELYLSLWSLLFLVPGIIKSYSYFMVDYIVAENPGIDANRAITISRRTMNGEKFNLFALELSFIGWALLSILTCGIGFVFLTPYIEATKAEYYSYLRDKAIANAFADISDLPGIAQVGYEGL